jgi:hypothetical protein
VTIKKLFLSALSFLLIFSLVFVTIESVDPEPALAASWDCLDSNGRPIAFQTKYSSSNLNVIRYNFSTGSESTTTFSGSGFSGSGEINASFMDLDGNLYVQRKKTTDSNSASRMYLVNPTGSPTLISSNYTGTGLNAATFFVDNGHKYAIYSKGHFSSGGGFARFNPNDPTDVDKFGGISTSSTGITSVARSKAKDFTWIRDNSSFPAINGNRPNFIGLDGTNDRIYASYYTISGQGGVSESISIVTKAYPVSVPDSGDFGAIFGFGGDELYVANNSTGNVYKITPTATSYSLTLLSGQTVGNSNNGYFSPSSNNDGAACHAGSPDTTFNPTVTATQGSCDGSNREIDVTLNNSSSNVTTSFVVTYTVNGGSSQSLTSGTSVSASSNGSLTLPSQVDNASVVISWYAENTTENLREPVTGTTSLTTITVDASSCSPTPTSKSSSSSVSAAFGSCSSGSATSTLTITNSDSSTVYYYVDYSINGGTYVNASTNLSVSAGATNTSLSTSVSHGQNITWRFKASNTNNDFTGLSYSTLTASSNLDCPVIDTTGASSFGSCAAGSKTSTFTMSNSSSANTAAFFRVQYSINGGSFQNAVTNQSVGINSSETTSVSVPHGSTIQWQYEISNTSNTFTGTYTQESTSSAVDCPTIDISASQSLGSCSAGSSTSTLTLSNSNSANSTAYFYVEYSIDGGSNWNEKASNQSVVQNGTESLTQSVTHGTAITWRYKSSSTSGSFTGDFTTLSESATVDCPVLDTSVSSSLGSCGSGTALSTFIINNSSSANTTAYFQVEYKLSSESSYTSLASNQAVAPDGTTSFNKAVPHGENITWQYRTSSTSNTFSGSYSFGGTSAIVDCPVLATSVSFLLDLVLQVLKHLLSQCLTLVLQILLLSLESNILLMVEIL